MLVPDGAGLLQPRLRDFTAGEVDGYRLGCRCQECFRPGRILAVTIVVAYAPDGPDSE